MRATLITEPECIAMRLVEATEDAVVDTQALNYLFECAKTWAPGKPHPAAIADMQQWACSMQFDAQRLQTLVQGQTQALRRLYSLSLYAVDCLRIADGLNPQAPPVAVEHLAACINTLADMQEAIAALFPGEKILGD